MTHAEGVSRVGQRGVAGRSRNGVWSESVLSIGCVPFHSSRATGAPLAIAMSNAGDLVGAADNGQRFWRLAANALLSETNARRIGWIWVLPESGRW
jgi:hypothetical protein